MSISAQMSDAARRVHEKLQAFVASGEYNVSQGRVVTSDAITGGKATAYDFSQVFSVEGTDDATMLFPHMKELEQTLRSEAVHAKEVMIHDAQEGTPLASGVRWLFGNPKGVVSGKYVFGTRQNIRLLSFDESDGHRYAVLLVWEQQIKPDQQVGNFWMMNGTIFEITAKKHDDMPFLMPYSERQNMTATIKYDTDPTAPQTYDELLAKVKQTCHIYDRETSGGKTAAVVILHKMCDGYPNKLTQEQYNTLIGILSPYAETASGQKHKEMFGYTCYTLYKKSEHYQAEGGEVKRRPAMITSSTISTTQLRKIVSYNGLITNGSEDLQQVDCQISGTAPTDADSITVAQTSYEVGDSVKITDGPFNGFGGTVDEIDQDRSKLRQLHIVNTVPDRYAPVEENAFHVNVNGALLHLRLHERRRSRFGRRLCRRLGGRFGRLRSPGPSGAAAERQAYGQKNKPVQYFPFHSAVPPVIAFCRSL